MSIESELAQAVRFLDIISNELGSINKHLEALSKRTQPRVEPRVFHPVATTADEGGYCSACEDDF
jgi:hypothetical protein